MSNIDEEIEKAERLRDILKECKELQEPVELKAEPLNYSYERCCDCPYKRCSEPIWLYDPWRITRGDRTGTSPELYRDYYTCSSD